MENKTFAQIVKLVYEKLGALVFAIDFKSNSKTVIRLNPSDFIINNIDKNEIHLYTICTDPNIAEGVETL